MKSSTLLLIIFGLFTVVNIICAIILYPELRELIKELKNDEEYLGSK